MFTRRTGQVFVYELKRNLRRKGFLFMTFGIPALAFVLLVGYQIITNLNKGSESDAAQQQADAAFDFRGIQKAGYVDLSGAFSEPGGRLAETLVKFPDEGAAQAALDAGEIDVYYVIAPDYLETGDVTLYVPTLALNQIGAWPIEQLVYTQLAGSADPAVLGRLRYPASIQETNPKREGALDEGARFGLMYAFSLGFIVAVFVTSGYLMQSVIDEKESRLVEILIASLRPTQLLAGKILALGVLGLTQIVTWVIALLLLVRLAGAMGSTLFFLVNMTIPLDILPIVLAYFVLGYLFFAAAYGAVGALSTSMQEGPQYAVVFSIPAALPYYFIGVFMQSPEAPLPVIMSLFPLTSPLAMVMRLSVSPVPAYEVILSLALLALAGVGVMWLAGRLFRVQTLLAGHTPRVRDIPRLIRG